MSRSSSGLLCFFFFNDTATTEIYTLSLHDALPILSQRCLRTRGRPRSTGCPARRQDRKSTRLNSSHQIISYAVFCLKKKKNNQYVITNNKKKTPTNTKSPNKISR